MINTLPVLLKDGYKVGHKFQYPSDTTLVYSNWTPRGSRVAGAPGIILFGPQYFAQEYLVRQFNHHFFDRPRRDVMAAYRRRIEHYLGPNAITYDHIEALHDLGYLPLQVKALPEGTLVPFRVPCVTVVNTHDDFFWLTNMLETLMSNVLWLPCTSATTAFLYRRTFQFYAKKTGGDLAMVPWQGHDFSMRGLPGMEAAALSGAAHLLSFTGSDTIPAIDFLEQYYGANVETELVAGSVPATEHSVMSMGMQAGELETFRRLITEVVPKGIVSVVSDTWDFWKVLTEYLPALKDVVLARDGKLVIRPDSGDPVKIICGDDGPCTSYGRPPAVRKGAIEVLWDIFGGTINDAGYRELDPHIGLIYGDSITRDRQEAILSGLQHKGFASTNVVLGIGSFTYQHVTRDTYGFAMKATYGETRSRGPQNLFKDPATDDGTKKSATGLLCVTETEQTGIHGVPELRVEEGCSAAREEQGLLQTIFQNGHTFNTQTLAEIRQRVERLL